MSSNPELILLAISASQSLSLVHGPAVAASHIWNHAQGGLIRCRHGQLTLVQRIKQPSL
jgi:hypothetical protein